MLRIGMVAGETSGDYLGAELLRELKSKGVSFTAEGIAGPAMVAEGCVSLFEFDKLGVMGFVEVLGSYLELYQIRKKLIQYFLSHPPDIFIGIDAPDFNLGVEQKLKKQGISTAHYVSPSIWAWRRKRIKKIKKSVDMMLTLFPFELDIYGQHNIPAYCVGHPLARQIALEPNPQSAREKLGIRETGQVVGLMPGSRKSELKYLLTPFLKTADKLFRNSDKLSFIMNVVNSQARQEVEKTVTSLQLSHLPLSIYEGNSHEVIESSDVLLLASGTITLEAMLFKKPMVVAYVLHPISHFIVSRLVYIKHASLPNLLANKTIVPECLQGDCTVEKLSTNIQYFLDNSNEVETLKDKFMQLHERLLGKDTNTASDKVLKMMNGT